MLSVDEVKVYLRLDTGGEEDELLTAFISSAKEIVENVIRKKISEFNEVPETIRQTMLIVVSTLYENREVGKGGLNMEALIDLVRRMTFAYRQERW